MKTMKFAAAMLACLSAAMAFNCPEDSHSFYHADVSTGCQVYHHCKNSELQTLSCPSGQAFNHVTSQCEDASTVDCIETMGEHSHHHHEHHHHHKRSVDSDFNCPEDAHTFYHADVSTGCQVYHVCENSQMQTLTCPQGEAFNHVTLQCEDASNVDCVETMGEHSHHHHEHHHHQKRSVDLPFNCPEDSHTFYHADVSTGCQVYHLCQNSELQTLTCPPGEAFNHVTLKCEDASTVDCIETMGEHSHHHHEHHHHHKRSVDLDFNCPEDAHNFYHADVSTGCQVYHLCQNSELQTLTCPQGEAFNHVTLQCEDASTVECVETMPEHSHHHHEHHHHHKRSVGSDFNCPEDAHNFYHADVSTGCQVYHHCQNFQMQTLTCPQGEAFNHVTLQCEDASTVSCIETMGEHSHHHHEHHHHQKRSVDSAFNCPEDSHTFYHADVSTGCQVYHLCQNSQLQTLSCPPGQAFSHMTLQCEDASTVECVETMGEHSHHHHEHMLHKRSASLDFNCPEDAHTFYHADVSTGCQVYHLCQNSQMQTFTCPSGQAFNHVTLQCEDSSSVNCIETMSEHSHHHHQMHHHHKRSAEVTVLEDREMSESNKETIAPAMKENNRKNIHKESVLAQIAHVFNKGFKKLCKRYKCGPDFDIGSFLRDLNNSDSATRQNLQKVKVSKEDEQVRNKRESGDADINNEPLKLNKITTPVATEKNNLKNFQDERNLVVYIFQVLTEALINFCKYNNCDNSVDFDPILREWISVGFALPRNLTKAKASKEAEQVRNKRDTRGAEIDSVADAMMYLTEKYATDALYGNGTSFLFKIVMPVFYEMMESEQTRMDVLSVVISAKNIFKPVALQILRNQNSADKLITVPRRIYDNSVKEFLKENRIVIEKVIERHLKAFASAAQESVPFFVESYERLKAGKYPQADALKKAAVYFYQKHGKLLQTSSSTSVKFYPVKEILQDIIPIKNALRQIFMDYFNLGEDSWLSFIFGDVQTTENVSPKYTKPIPKLYSKKSAY